MKYKGFDIVLARAIGGKAWKGCNKTSPVQVLEPHGPGGYVLMRKQVRFKMGDRESLKKAVQKAMAFVTSLPPPPKPCTIK